MLEEYVKMLLLSPIKAQEVQIQVLLQWLMEETWRVLAPFWQMVLLMWFLHTKLDITLEVGYVYFIISLV